MDMSSNSGRHCVA